jgi:hypothetical protein
MNIEGMARSALVGEAERANARWDEEVDLVAATVELDERTSLIAVGRRLELTPSSRCAAGCRE